MPKGTVLNIDTLDSEDYDDLFSLLIVTRNNLDTHQTPPCCLEVR